MMNHEAPLPGWLESPDAIKVSEGPSKRCRRRGFLEKTLHAIAEAIKNEIFSERCAQEPGFLQGVDPRAKLVTVLLLIGTAGLVHHIPTLIALNVWLFWLATISRIPIRLFIKRVWLVVPLFTGLVVFPATLNIVQPGTPLWVLFHFSHPLHLGWWNLPQEVAITSQGLAAAVLLVLRVGASVSLAVLLTLTTRWSVLMKALGTLRIPEIFIAVLEITFRYVFLLLQISSDMFAARKSRTVGRASSREQRRFVAASMGSLWSKTHATSEEVHGAMLARGYTGHPKSLVHFTMKRSDALWVAFVILFVVLMVGGDRLLV